MERPTEPARNHDLAEVIRAQHAQLREILDRLSRQPAVTEGILEPQLRARRHVLRELERAFLAQQAVRMRHLWPALRRAWPDGRAYTDQAWARARTIEYRMAKRQWLGERDEAANDIEDHIAADIERQIEAEEWQLVRLEGPSDRTGLDGTALAARLRSGGPWPSRPHPDVPRAPWLAARLQRLLGLSDRVLESCAYTKE